MNAVAIGRIPREEKLGRALVLALVVHLALLAFLWIGVRWQNEPAVAEAEVWDVQVREAAPKPAAQPEPVAPQPEPIVKAPVAPEPKPAQREAVAKPDIALEREKKRKEEQKAKELAAEQAKRQKEQEKQAKLAEQKKQAEQKKREQAQQKAIEAARAEELRRLAAATGSGGSGTAAKSTGRTDGGYQQKIMAKIKSNTAFVVPPGLVGNPSVEYAVELLPDGHLRSAPRKLKSSGVPGFDEASLRAIEKSAPFPADRYGKVPSSMKITHKPKE